MRSRPRLRLRLGLVTVAALLGALLSPSLSRRGQNPAAHPPKPALTPVARAADAARPAPDAPVARAAAGTSAGAPSPVAAFDEWLVRFRRGENPPVAIGVQLAQARRPALKKLIAADPRAALAQAVPRSLRTQLPAEIVAELETPIDAHASLQVQAACFGGRTEISRWITVEGRRLEAHTFGARLATLSKTRLPVHGFALDERAVADELPYRRLEGEELAARDDGAGGVVAAIGGDVRRFASEADLAAWRERIAVAERAPDPDARLGADEVAAAPAGWTFGEKRVLWLCVEFADEPGRTAASEATIMNSMATVNQYIQDVSHGRCSLRTAILPVGLRLAQTRAYYNSNGGRLGELEAETLRLAREYDAANGGGGAYNPDQADRWLILFRSLSVYSWGGIATIGGKGVSMNENWGAGVVAHELGHNQGLQHSHAWKPGGSSAIEAGEHVEYGDMFDVMGSSDSIPEGHFNAKHKETLLYLESANITTVTASGTYRVFRHDHRGAAGVQALRIAAGAYEYLVEHRRLVPRTAQAHGDRVRTGACVHWTRYPDGVKGPGTYLLDATPQSAGDMNDAPFELNHTFTDPGRGISITPVAHGGAEPREWIDVRVDFGASGNNRNPVLAAAPPTPIVPARTDITLRATASDPDGDTLSYLWQIGGEEIITMTPTLTYRWPAGGSYTVTCAARDGRGGYAAQSFELTVEDSLTTWTRRAQGLTTRSFAAIIHARNQFVAIGSAAATSPDGIAWTLGDALTAFCNDITHGDGGYVAVGSRTVSGQAAVYMARSSNGLQWQETSPAGSTASLNSVAFGAGRYVAVGRNGAIFHSVDGTGWKQPEFTVTRTLHEVRFAAGLFMIVGEGGTILTSTDGLEWKDRSLAVGWQIVVATHHRNQWIISGQGQRWSSTDAGATWIHAILPGKPLLHSLAPAGQLLLASQVAYDDLHVSEDGQRWAAVPVIVPRTRNAQWAIAEANGTVVLAGYDGKIYQSTIRSIQFSPPAITAPPRAQGIAAGQSVTLSVTATGGGLSYQWHKNGTPLAGATAATYVINGARPEDAGAYSVTVTNFTGSITSAAATLTLEQRTVYITQMAAGRTAAAGTDVTLAVAAAGVPPLTYQWSKDGEIIPGATSASLPLGPVTPADAGSYTVAVSDPSGTAFSERATLQVTGEAPFMVSTLAGQLRATGTTDGAAAEARFTLPGDLAVDAAGYIYVSDRSSHTIRRISQAGEVTTFAGRAGAPGFAEGRGVAAQFNLPAGLVFDPQGNLFVADTNNNRIRKITPEGVVSTVAGQAQGSVDGTGTGARLALPRGIAMDRGGNLYWADGLTHTIRKMTPGGAVTTLAGRAAETGTADGAGATARFNSPTGVAVDAGGNIFVADTNNHVIRRITPAGEVSTFAGQAGTIGSTDGTIAAARFNFPGRLVIDAAGNLYVTATTAVRRISPAGIVTTPVGAGGFTGTSYVDGPGTTARFALIQGMAADPFGTLYLADGSNALVRKAAPVGQRGAGLSNLSVRSVAGTGADTLIVGFSLAAGSKPLLIRAVGPTLGSFGVGEALGTPTLKLMRDGATVSQNQGWSDQAADAIAAVTARVGAFALPARSKDAALLETLQSGSYTAQVGGGVGVALVEVYDTATSRFSTTFATPKLANVSARTRAGTGAETLIVGFVISGSAPKTVLLRGIGPTLASFGVEGALTLPKLAVFRDTRLVAENAGWSGENAIVGAAERVGAFPLPSSSRDAVLLLTLLPGAYTAQLTGQNGTGVALVEIYDVP